MKNEYNYDRIMVIYENGFPKNGIPHVMVIINVHENGRPYIARAITDDSFYLLCRSWS